MTCLAPWWSARTADPPVSVTYAPQFNVQGSNADEIRALLVEHDADQRRTLPGVIVKTVRQAQSRRMI